MHPRRPLVDEPGAVTRTVVPLASDTPGLVNLSPDRGSSSYFTASTSSPISTPNNPASTRTTPFSVFGGATYRARSSTRG